jgi:hypothetical protein
MATLFSRSHLAYESHFEQSMRDFFQTLPEKVSFKKDRRRYAGVEAQRLGHGGQTYIASVLGCSRDTVAAGMKELASLPEPEEMSQRSRRPGGGRKSATEAIPELVPNFFLSSNHELPVTRCKKVHSGQT